MDGPSAKNQDTRVRARTRLFSADLDVRTSGWWWIRTFRLPCLDRILGYGIHRCIAAPPGGPKRTGPWPPWRTGVRSVRIGRVQRAMLSWAFDRFGARYPRLVI